MNDKYTVDEFCRAYSWRGLGRRTEARQWMHELGMKEATEADFERCYHVMNGRKILGYGNGRRYTGGRIDAGNGVAMSHEGD